MVKRDIVAVGNNIKLLFIYFSIYLHWIIGSFVSKWLLHFEEHLLWNYANVSLRFVRSINFILRSPSSVCSPAAEMSTILINFFCFSIVFIRLCTLWLLPWLGLFAGVKRIFEMRLLVVRAHIIRELFLTQLSQVHNEHTHTRHNVQVRISYKQPRTLCWWLLLFPLCKCTRTPINFIIIYS